jgi:hypothetical protein
MVISSFPSPSLRFHAMYLGRSLFDRYLKTNHQCYSLEKHAYDRIVICFVSFYANNTTLELNISIHLVVL